ncbi:MAG: D-TA family PLP-dependent enzyme [Gemmatimonadales bacterium]|nr:MAG: D-TA family PLP-dependent enzyme [Gemmatimonadales bacterium]
MDTVETPAAIVDLARVRRNLEATVAYTRAHGLGWRPHVKTHKSPDLARMQMDAGASGLTVATPREAEVMAPVTPDLLLAHPPVPPKTERLMRLPPGVRLTVALDDEALLAPLARAAAEAGRTVGVLVELDVGMGRVGLAGPPEVVALARRISAAGPDLEWRGLLFYPGHIRVTAGEQAPLLAGVASRLDAVLEALQRAGLAPAVVSGGSTPTLFQSHLIPGLTEIRPGTSIFHDRDSVALGAATLDDVAYTVLATVVSTAVPGHAVVDAGSKALAREEFRAVPGQGGFGILLDRPEVRVISVSEEHGVLDLAGTSWRPRVGDRVRIVPNHVCVSVNLQDRLLTFDPGDGATGKSLGELPLSGRGRLAVQGPEVC